MKKYLLILGIEVLACMLLCLLLLGVEGGLMGLLAMPFGLLGDVLRDMSLSGDAGNIVAIMLYVIICCIPLLVAVIKYIKKKHKIEDGLLVVLSVALFLIIYIMINPHYVNSLVMSESMMIAVRGVIAGTAYSVIVAYVCIKVIRKISVKEDNKNRHKKYLIPLLWVLVAFFVYNIFGGTLTSLADGIDSVRTNYYEYVYEEVLGVLMVILKHAIDMIMTVIYIVITIAFIKLVEKLDVNNISETLVEDSRRIAMLCKVSVCYAVLSNVLYNILVLVFIKNLRNIISMLEFPVFSIMFALMITVLAHFINDAKTIKEENDMFI